MTGKKINILVLICALLLNGCSIDTTQSTEALQSIEASQSTEVSQSTDISQSIDTSQNTEIVQSVEEAENKGYDGNAYVEINDNIPDFTDEDKKQLDAFETYSNLDSLGRCQVAYANICQEIMPTEERGSIGQIRPSGWHTVKYNDIIDGNYLYNRCHLIGYQLAGENANEKNLITGTRYLNIIGMLEFENEVGNYVRTTDNHVLYRVTPIFEGDNLVADGVQMEAWSVEDNGKGICFNVFCYNVQPGIDIDYSTGESHVAQNAATDNKATDNKATDSKTTDNKATDNKATDNIDEKNKDNPNKDASDNMEFVINTNTKKFHIPTCSCVDDILPKNKKVESSTIAELEEKGYSPCKRCIGGRKK